MTDPFTVLFDACVLYPAPLRDFLMRLAMFDRFRAWWTNQIHEEWINALLEQRKDLRREQLERTKDLMNAHVRDCLVERYEGLIEGLSLPDPNDRHVLAAAIRSNASVIVTFNLKDFPAESLEPYGIEAHHPDEFIMHLFDLNSSLVLQAAKMQRASLKNPPKTADEFLERLELQGLPLSTRELRKYKGLI